MVALLAGFIDAIGGGGGLIILPALLLARLSLAQALATNKFQAIFGKLSSVRYFFKEGVI
ncbi:TSUP family transporter [Photobacterium sp. BZF1]|nr:TSUP family transporter [Photobacterium sp. BZF1]MBC7001735.1 TSUP family transporter [Photobacterium sp. BZF1]